MVLIKFQKQLKEKSLSNSYGGKMILHLQIHYSSSNIIENSNLKISEEKLISLLRSIKSQKIL